MRESTRVGGADDAGSAADCQITVLPVILSWSRSMARASSRARARCRAILLLTFDRTTASLLSMNYKTIVLALLLAAGSLHAQTPSTRDRVLVQPAWLAEHLQDRDLVLLHVGPRPEYNAGHIPGARYLNYQDLAVTDRWPAGSRCRCCRPTPCSRGWPRPASPPVAHRRLLRAREPVGVADGARDVHARLCRAGRAVVPARWRPRGLGEGWKAAAQPSCPRERTGTLSPLTLRPIVVDAEFVKANLASTNIAIVDGRNTGFYSGAQTGGGPTAPHKTGHIQGAGSVPFNDTVDQANRLKPAAELQKLFADAGVGAGRHGRRLLPHRPAGNAGDSGRAHARAQGVALRRLVRGVVAKGLPGREPGEEVARRRRGACGACAGHHCLGRRNGPAAATPLPGAKRTRLGARGAVREPALGAERPRRPPSPKSQYPRAGRHGPCYTRRARRTVMRQLVLGTTLAGALGLLQLMSGAHAQAPAAQAPAPAPAPGRRHRRRPPIRTPTTPRRARRSSRWPRRPARTARRSGRPRRPAPSIRARSIRRRGSTAPLSTRRPARRSGIR